MVARNVGNMISVVKFLFEARIYERSQWAPIDAEEYLEDRRYQQQ